MNDFNFDFSQDKPDIREPIPKGTKLFVRMAYTPGGFGPANSCHKSKETDSIYLKTEFTVLRGPYRGRKFWSNMTIAGGKLDEKGQSIAAGITRKNIRLIIDSSRGLSPKDESPNAAAQRVLPNGFADLQGREFICTAGVEEDKTGKYGPRNSLGRILTIDDKDYPKSEAELDNPVVPGAPAPAALPAAPAPAWGAAASAQAATAAVNPAIAQAPVLVAPEQQLAPAPAVAAQVFNGQVNGDSPIPQWMRGAA